MKIKSNLFVSENFDDNIVGSRVWARTIENIKIKHNDNIYVTESYSNTDI